MDKIQMAKQLRMALQMFAETIEDDVEAISIKSLYPKWETVIGKQVKQGYKFIYEEDLYKVIATGGLVIQEHYIPGQGTESLYARIDETHAGTPEDPIPYNGNMELFNGKYYIQNDIIYKCIRDSGQPLYHNLADLVGTYVEVYEG